MFPSRIVPAQHAATAARCGMVEAFVAILPQERRR
jgi:hypothetical protein